MSIALYLAALGCMVPKMRMSLYVRVYNALKVMIYPGGQLSQFFLKTLSFNSEGLTINDVFFK